MPGRATQRLQRARKVQQHAGRAEALLQQRLGDGLDALLAARGHRKRHEVVRQLWVGCTDAVLLEVVCSSASGFVRWVGAGPFVRSAEAACGLVLEGQDVQLDMLSVVAAAWSALARWWYCWTAAALPLRGITVEVLRSCQRREMLKPAARSRRVGR